MLQLLQTLFQFSKKALGLEVLPQQQGCSLRALHVLERFFRFLFPRLVQLRSPWQ
jgi:hypothetical protein